jgi:hypothetical protein
MTKAELIAALNDFDDDATVIVAIFYGETQAEVSDIELVTCNGQAAQISVESHAQFGGWKTTATGRKE